MLNLFKIMKSLLQYNKIPNGTLKYLSLNKLNSLLKYYKQGFGFLVSIFLFLVISGNAYAVCGTVPTGRITSVSPSSCSTFSPSCAVTVSWVTDCNDDGDPASMFNIKINGNTYASGYSGTTTISFTSPATIVFEKDSFGTLDSKSVTLAPTPIPTATPTPTSTPNYNLHTRACNAACGNDNECYNGLSCINGLCRLPSNPNDSSCTTPSYSSSTSNPTSTPTKAPTGGTNSSAGSTNSISGVTPTAGSSGILGTTTTTDSSNSQTSNTGSVLGTNDITPTNSPTDIPNPTQASSTITQIVKDHPIISTIIGVFVFGSVAFLIKFRKDLAIF